jgi:hypothetical protein
MKKLMITIILATACQFTFANNLFHHEREGRRFHERENCGQNNYSRPHAEIIVSRPCEKAYVNRHERFWVEGQRIINRWGYERWIPGHWEY